MKRKELKKIIKAFSGVQRLAEHIGVSHRTIEGWVYGKPIPEPTKRLLRIEYESRKDEE